MIDFVNYLNADIERFSGMKHVDPYIWRSGERYRMSKTDAYGGIEFELDRRGLTKAAVK